MKWKAEEPSVVSRTFGIILSPVTWLIQKIIPVAAIRGVLDFSSSQQNGLQIPTIFLGTRGSLRCLTSRHMISKNQDNLANEVHNWAIGSRHSGREAQPALLAYQAWSLIFRLLSCLLFAQFTKLAALF